MPDTDRILEAEQSIQSIASELKRMRNAANLLQGAQTQAKAVIASAQRVVEATDRFSSQCGAVVAKLDSTDLSEQFNKLIEEISQLATEIKEFRDQHDSIARGAKMRQITTMAFVMITSIVVFVILYKILVAGG